MHFGEMDHLPYRHAQFVPSSSMDVLQISSFFLMIDLRLLHDHFFVPICWDISLVGGFFSPSLGYLFLGEGFFPCDFLSFPIFRNCIVHGYLTWPRCQDPSIIHLSFLSLRNFPKLHLLGGIRLNN